MPQRSESATFYVCDNCKKIDQATGMTASAAPSGWRSVMPASTQDGDWFCSWECLSEWSLAQAELRDEKLAEIKARVDEEAKLVAKVAAAKVTK